MVPYWLFLKLDLVKCSQALTCKLQVPDDMPEQRIYSVEKASNEVLPVLMDHLEVLNITLPATVVHLSFLTHFKTIFFLLTVADLKLTDTYVPSIKLLD